MSAGSWCPGYSWWYCARQFWYVSTVFLSCVACFRSATRRLVFPLWPSFKVEGILVSKLGACIEFRTCYLPRFVSWPSERLCWSGRFSSHIAMNFSPTSCLLYQSLRNACCSFSNKRTSVVPTFAACLAMLSLSSAVVRRRWRTCWGVSAGCNLPE